MNHLFEIIAVIFSIFYILLAIAESSLCWYTAFISTAIFAVIFWQSHLVMSTVMQIYFMLMAIYGWYRWRNNLDDTKTSLPITRLTFQQHFVTLTLILLPTFFSASFLSLYSSAKSPFLDSLITWGSIVTTYLMANKKLEHWLYWVVIDVLAIGLYFQRDLQATAILFVINSVLALVGYFHWNKSFRLRGQHFTFSLRSGN